MDSKPVYSLDGVEFQLQTSWGGDYQTTFRSWPIGTTVTYAIAATTPIDGDSGWQAMDSGNVQLEAAQDAFAIWAELIGNIQLVAVTDASQADITFSLSTDLLPKSSGSTRPTLGPQVDSLGAYPDFPITHEAVRISATDAGNSPASLILNSFGLTTFLHEIGHALGLSHPGTYDAADTVQPTYADDAVFAQDSLQYTIMSYFGSEFAAGWDTASVNGLNPSTPMLYDIATIQSLYGVNWTTRDTDTTYGYNSTAGWDFFNFAVDSHPVFTIWDGGGNDTIYVGL